MASNRAPSTPFTISEDLSAYISWRHPSRTMQIYLEAQSVQMLSLRSLRQSKTAYPAEIGGLLWGKLLEMEQSTSALVLVPELVQSETLLFNTTENDSRQLVAALDRPPQSGLQLLGYFRSHLREGLCLGQQDEAFIRQYLSDPNSVFLVIRPFEIGICMAGFFFWDHGRLQTDVSDLEVPFVSPENGARANSDESSNHGSLASGSTVWTESAVEREPNRKTPAAESPYPPHAVVPASHTLKSSPKPEEHRQAQPLPPPRRDARRPPLHSILVSFILLLCAGLAIYFALLKLGLHLAPQQAAAARTEVGLQVKVAPSGQMDLSWDQNSPDLKKAKGATLTIVDGTLHRELSIDNNQLRFGQLAYFPNGNDVQFYLEIHLDSSRSIAESVRVLSQKGEASYARPATPARTPDMRSGTGLTSPRPRALSSSAEHLPAVPQNVLAGAVAPAPDAVKSLPRELTTAVGTLIAIRAVPRTISPPPFLDSPAGILDEPAANIRLAAVPLPPAPQLKTPPPAPAANPPSIAASAYTPPRPLRQVLPSAALSGPFRENVVTSITVQLKINEKGRVTGVHITHEDPGADAIMAAQAGAAARQWIFRPATLHGKNVPSDHTIVFRFRPTE